MRRIGSRSQALFDRAIAQRGAARGRAHQCVAPDLIASALFRKRASGSRSLCSRSHIAVAFRPSNGNHGVPIASRSVRRALGWYRYPGTSACSDLAVSDPEREEAGWGERAAVREVVEADRQPDVEVLARRVAE